MRLINNKAVQRIRTGLKIGTTDKMLTDNFDSLKQFVLLQEHPGNLSYSNNQLNKGMTIY